MGREPEVALNMRRGAGPVRIQIPASVGFNLDIFQKSLSSLAERLGCPTCFSGYDCTFLRESRFAVNPKTAQIEPIGGGLMIDTVPRPDGGLAIGTWPNPERDVLVNVPSEIAYNLSKFQRVVGNLAERLACPNCTSGYNVAYRMERDFTVNPKSLDLESVGGVIIGSG